MHRVLAMWVLILSISVLQQKHLMIDCSNELVASDASQSLHFYWVAHVRSLTVRDDGSTLIQEKWYCGIDITTIPLSLIELCDLF